MSMFDPAPLREEASFEPADHHLGGGRLLARLRFEPLEKVEQHRRVLDRVRLDLLVDDEGHRGEANPSACARGSREA